MKKYIHIALFTITLLTLDIKDAEAQVAYGDYGITIVCVKHCDGGNADVEINGLTAVIRGTVIKVVNLVRSSGNFVNHNFNLNIGSIVNLDAQKTFGSWFFIGAYDDSPSSDGVMYRVYNDPYAPRVIDAGTSIPNESTSNPRIRSSNQNVVDCTNTGCIARKPGTATVTVSFPPIAQTSAFPFSLNQGGVGDPMGYGKVTTKIQELRLDRSTGKTSPITDSNGKILGLYRVATSYELGSIEYQVTVPPDPNLPHVVACTGISNISKNGGTANWNYYDINRDLQSNYVVQVSTDPSFINGIVKSITAPANTNVSAVRNTVLSGLNSNTKYYVRVRAYNSTNGWSAYSSCGSGFTTATDTTIPPNCFCDKRDQVCSYSNSTSTQKDAPVCYFSSACTVTSDQNDVTFRVLPINSLGNVNYQHESTSTDRSRGVTYVYTTPKTSGTQSVNFLLTDTYDNKTSSSMCSIDNPPIDTPPEVTPTSTSTSTSTPKIVLTKIPSVVLNKGGSCTINWAITNIPEDTICTLSGVGVNPPSNVMPIIQNNGFKKIDTIYVNQKYVLKCAGPSLNPEISKSVICRVNPDISEN